MNNIQIGIKAEVNIKSMREDANWVADAPVISKRSTIETIKM